MTNTFAIIVRGCRSRLNTWRVLQRTTHPALSIVAARLIFFPSLTCPIIFYRFSPLKLLEEGTTVSAGTFNDISYTLNARDGWFVSAQTGEIFGKFDQIGSHKIKLQAVDSAGRHAPIEEMVFNVMERPKFGLKGQGTSADNVSWVDVGFTAAEKGTGSIAGRVVQYAIGSTVKIPPLQRTASQLFVNPSFNDFSKVTYKRSIVPFGTTVASNPGLWLVDTATGEMLAQPENAGMYSAELIATDGGGADVVTRRWSFEVLFKDVDVAAYGPGGADCLNGARIDNGNDFDKSFACNCDGTQFEGVNCELPIVPTQCNENEALVRGVCRAFQLAVSTSNQRTNADQDVYTDPTARAFYTVQDFASYRIAPLAIDDARTNYSSGNQSDVTYTMTGDTDGFFLNTVNGEMLGTFANFDDDKEATRALSITLKAVDGSGIQQVLETMAMNVRYPDLEVEEFGPNGHGCNNSGIRMDGFDGNGDKFDQSYVCECVSDGLTSYSGDNCEIGTTDVAASAAVVEGGETLVGGIVAGSFVFILLVAFAIYRQHAYQVKMRAFDFAAELALLIDSGTIDKSENTLGIPREVKRSSITMVKAIGSGAFGEVWKGILDESSSGGVPGYACEY